MSTLNTLVDLIALNGILVNLEITDLNERIIYVMAHIHSRPNAHGKIHISPNIIGADIPVVVSKPRSFGDVNRILITLFLFIGLYRCFGLID